MAKITDITAQKRNALRVNIFLDGTYYCALDALTAKKNRLEIGDEVDEEFLSAVQAESETTCAFEKAVKYLSVRMRTKKETERYLKEKGYLPQTVEAVMEKLSEYKFISDELFCKEYVRSYATREGVKKIRADLQCLGADDEAIENALASVESQEDEAYACAVKYLRTHKTANLMKVKNHLFVKGFESEDISVASAKIKEEVFSEEDEEW